MGSIEAEAKRKVRKGEIQKIILESVKVAGLVSLLVVAPNVIGAMAKLGIIRSPRQRELVGRSCDRLVRAGQLQWENGKLRLTSKGESAILRLMLREMSNTKRRRWDKRWRVLIFDIPEYKKHIRDRIRETLRIIGFVHLQHSVWVYPYDCEDLITLLKADFKIGKDVLYVIAEAIENDKGLRDYFGVYTD